MAMSRRNRSNPLGMNRWQRQQEERDRRESVQRDAMAWGNLAEMLPDVGDVRRGIDGVVGIMDQMSGNHVEVAGRAEAVGPEPDRTVATLELGNVDVSNANAHRFMRLVAGYGGDEDAPSVHVSHDGVTWEPLPGVRVEFENEFGNVAPLAVESPVAQQLAEPDLPSQLLNEILVDGVCDPEGDDARGWRAIAEGLRRELVRERGTLRMWRNNYQHASSRATVLERVADHDGRLCMACARELSSHAPAAGGGLAPIGTPPLCTTDINSKSQWTPTLPGAAWCHDCSDHHYARYRPVWSWVVCDAHRPVEAKMADIGGTRGIKLQQEEMR